MPTTSKRPSGVRRPQARPADESGAGGEIQQRARGEQPVLSTRDGMPISDNQNSLRVAPRGSSVLDDLVFLDKISHFDRERIPERVVHARASGAHGHFVLTKSLARYTTAKMLTELGQRTPVFARLSTVAGPSGSPDTVRDVRGFAVKFYTAEGNWDLVGNNIPVFFIQDAMKFPDLVHAVKREPDRGFPTAASAHDTFWDFVSLMPESLHMVMWIMSDRALPRSLSMMEGFGVHTFRLLNARGESTFVKYHWRPVLGAQSLLWDEAVKIAGADPDFHRRELHESITSGHGPAWDLAVQLFSEAEADALPFDVLDATKLIPEELVPLQVIGRMTLDRNPANFFAETEQVAFCPSHLLPGMDFSADPLLQGRALSYIDTQVHRLGGANAQQLPINRPQCPVHHFQRDGAHQAELPAGRVAYEPNSLAPDGPRASLERGQRSYAQPAVEGVRGRARPASFADHHSQARMFYRSQTDTEREHIIAALRFELAKVSTPAIRERVIGQLRVVDEGLAKGVALGLGLSTLPEAATPARAPIDLPPSPALSLLAAARPTLQGRCVGVLIADGADAVLLRRLVTGLEKEGARVKLIAPKVYGATLSDGRTQAADLQLDGAPSVFFDAVALVMGPDAARALAREPAAADFVALAYRHLKAIAFSPEADLLLEVAEVVADDFIVPLEDLAAFLQAAARRRWARASRLSPSP